MRNTIQRKGGTIMLKTEMRNPKSQHIDKMDTDRMLRLINEENAVAIQAVDKAIPQISKAVDVICNSFENGGRLFFIGAGTSGRLGIMDAAECPPTYGVPREMVKGIIAGGNNSVFVASESAEDNRENGANDVKENGVRKGDVLVGISVAGGAKYVIGAIEYAKRVGAYTIGLTCNENTKVEAVSDLCIVTDTGAEVVTGSTRMKGGTAHKIVLNMLTTASMIKGGKVYENMMINLKPSNEKLSNRMMGIVGEILSVDSNKAKEMLDECDWNIRTVTERFKGTSS